MIKSADFGPRLFLNPAITMISGPIVDGFYFWRRKSLLQRDIIAQNIPIIVGLNIAFHGSDSLSRVGSGPGYPTRLVMSTKPSDPTRPDPTRPDPTRPDPTQPDPTREI